MGRPKLAYYDQRRVYKYETAIEYRLQTGVVGYQAIDREYFAILTDGLMIARVGYAWDGASFPQWRTNNTMLGSLFHDIPYQAMRMGLLPLDAKSAADIVLYETYLKDGMTRLRATYSWQAVAMLGYASCRLDSERPREIQYV